MKSSTVKFALMHCRCSRQRGNSTREKSSRCIEGPVRVEMKFCNAITC